MANLAGKILHMDTTQPGSEEQLLEYADHEDDLVRKRALEMLSDFVSEPVIMRMATALRDDSEIVKKSWWSSPHWRGWISMQ